MLMMERLTKESNDLIRNRAISILRGLSEENKLSSDELSVIGSFLLIERAENTKLKGYKDLEEQGLLLKLPCKVGDTVAIVLMIPSNERKVVVQAEVKEINAGKYHTRIDTQIKVEPIARRGTSYKYYVSEWGTYIFATLAEAEKALEELSEVK